MTWCGALHDCLVVKFDSCNSLLSSVHTVLVNILQCVRLYIKWKYIIHARRALSSSSVDGVCAMLNHACTILEQDFREVLFSKLRQGFPSGFDLTQAYNFVQSSITQGRLQSTDVESEKAKAAFLVGFCSPFHQIMYGRVIIVIIIIIKVMEQRAKLEWVWTVALACN